MLQTLPAARCTGMSSPSPQPTLSLFYIVGFISPIRLAPVNVVLDVTPLTHYTAVLSCRATRSPSVWLSSCGRRFSRAPFKDVLHPPYYAAYAYAAIKIAYTPVPTVLCGVISFLVYKHLAMLRATWPAPVPYRGSAATLYLPFACVRMPHSHNRMRYYRNYALYDCHRLMLTMRFACCLAGKRTNRLSRGTVLW